MEAPPTPKRKRTFLRFGLVALALILALPAAYTYGSLNFVFSDGERVGYVQKLSRRGWLCKTNEGELALVNLPGQPAELFAFTVPDDKVADEIRQLAGHKVALAYEQHRGVPLSCFAETEYFVVRVRKAE